MTSLVIVLVLLAAAMHATWNALVKSSGDRLMTQVMVIGTGVLLAAGALPFVAIPARPSWPYVAASALLHNGYYLFLLLAYRHGDLSRVYPLARGSAPVLVAGLAVPLAHERLAPLQLGGVLLVSLGIASLAFAEGWPGAGKRKPLLYAGATGLFIAAYTLVDGLGVRRAGDAAGYIAWLFMLEGLLLAAVALVARRRTAMQSLRRGWRRGLFAGAIATAGYAIAIWAMSFTGLARVVALRECSVVIAALIGTHVLGEQGRGRRVLAAALVTAGNLLLNLR